MYRKLIDPDYHRHLGCGEEEGERREEEGEVQGEQFVDRWEGVVGVDCVA